MVESNRASVLLSGTRTRRRFARRPRAFLPVAGAGPDRDLLELEAKAMKRKPRRCRICKQRPIWTHGDVKDPGPVCKRCYHKHVWPERKAATRARPRAELNDSSAAPAPVQNDTPFRDSPPA